MAAAENRALKRSDLFRFKGGQQRRQQQELTPPCDVGLLPFHSNTPFPKMVEYLSTLDPRIFLNTAKKWWALVLPIHIGLLYATFENLRKPKKSNMYIHLDQFRYQTRGSLHLPNRACDHSIHKALAPDIIATKQYEIIEVLIRKLVVMPPTWSRQK